MAVPGRVIPNDPAVEQAVLQGENLFESIGCAACHKMLDPIGFVMEQFDAYAAT